MTVRVSKGSVAAAAVAFPLVLGVCVLFASGVTPQQIAGSRTIQLYYGSLIVILLGHAGSAIRARNHARLFLSLGLVLLLVQGAILSGGSLSGTARVGLGESLGAFDTLEAGPWARRRPVPITLVAAAEDPDGSCTLQIGDMPRKIAAGDVLSWAGKEIRCIGIHRAPLLQLLDNNGKELDGAYFPYADREGIPEFVQFKIVPHRFYLSRPGAAAVVWRKEGDVWLAMPAEEGSPGGESPERLRLQIIRGKLTLYDGYLEKGAAVPFDGHQVRYAGSERWAEIGIAQKHGLLLLWIGGAAMLFGIMINVRSHAGRS